MRATIIGKICDLSIACDNGDRRLLGDVRVEGRGFINAIFDEAAFTKKFSQGVEAFVSVFAQQSEALRRLLVVRDLDKRYQHVVDGYVDLRDLTTFDKEGEKLFINVMLNAADFNYFCTFVEMHFLTELSYVMDVPFHELPISVEEQTDLAKTYGYILPTKREFSADKPCVLPNAGLSFGFEHRKPNGKGALRPAMLRGAD